MEIEDYERFADELDLASKLEEESKSATIAEATHSLKPQTHPKFDGLHCVEEDCGDDLPEVRLTMGRIRCTQCQAILESKQRK